MGTITARGGRCWPLSQVSSFPSFYVQSETDPLPSFLPWTMSPSFSSVSSGVCLFCCLGYNLLRVTGCSDATGSPPRRKEQDPGELRQCNPGALLTSLLPSQHPVTNELLFWPWDLSQEAWGFLFAVSRERGQGEG